MTGDSFLLGVPLASDFDLELFLNKLAKRSEREPDDDQAAPGTNSGFAWNGLDDGVIPWKTMKSVWRRSVPGVCPNCSGETFLVNFGQKQVSFLGFESFADSVCPGCRRVYRERIGDARTWMRQNLDEEVMPEAGIFWGRRGRKVSN